jgi:hypothetical protein
MTPVCPLERTHDMIDSDDSIDCWACDVIRALYYIATGVTDNPSWDAQMTLDDNVEWRNERVED